VSVRIDPAARGAALATLLQGAWRPTVVVATDWCDDLTPFLLASGTAALAWRRLRARAGPEMGPLREAQRAQAVENATLLRQVLECFAILRRAGIEPILGKGWAVARLYPEAGLRPAGDIDLYVRSADHAQAAEELCSPPGPVDLHCGLGPLSDLGEEEVWSRSTTVAVTGGDVRVFDTADHLRLLALHTLGHGAWRPLWLCDVALAGECSPDAVRSALAWRHESWTTRAVACALRLARELLGAALDEAALVSLPLPSWAARSVLREWSRVAPDPHGQRTPLANVRGVGGTLHELRRRWPNPIEATSIVRAPWSALPRWPIQCAACGVRAARWVRAGLSR
jgi:Uncharacterised nucleotidyltransferase